MNQQIVNERETDIWHDVAKGIFEEGCVLDKRKNSKLEPYYIDARIRPEGLMSDELVERASLLLYRMMLRRNILEEVLIAGVPNAGTTFAKAIVKFSGGLFSELPISRELREFTVGISEKSNWKTVVPIENVVTSGGSLIRTIYATREAGFTVNDAFVLIEREDTAKYRLKDIGVNLHTVVSIKDLMDFGCLHHFILPDFRDECVTFRSFR